MSEPTYTEISRAKTTVTLLVNEGTDHQKAFWTCQADRMDHRLNAVNKARAKFGDDVRLSWLHADGHTTTIGF